MMSEQTDVGSSGFAELVERYNALLRGELSGDEAGYASQHMLEMLLESMAYAVFWKDVNSKYVGCNRAFCELAGFEQSLLFGKSDIDMPWADQETYDWEWFREWDRKVLETGEPSFGIVERIVRADGSIAWMETNKVPLRDSDGEVVGLLGNVQDVSESLETQRQLRRTLEELDDRVTERTAEIERANEALRREVDDRIRSQAEERQQRTYAETLRDTAAAMSQSFDLPTATRQALSGLERLVSNDLAAIVVTTDDHALQVSHHHSGFGYLEADIDIAPNSLEELSIIDRLQTGPSPAIVSDPERSLGPARCVLGARMRQGDQIVGYLFVESATAGFFTDDHAERLGAVADLAAAGLSHARLAQRVSEIAAVEERQRLARDLHDAINQTLWTATLSAETLLSSVEPESDIYPRVDRLRQLTRGALSEMRGMLLELRPGDLAEVELHELLRHLLNGVAARMKVDISDDLQPVDLPPATHTTLYRICQQALSNLVQHSNATEADVRLIAGPPTVLRVADNGDGFVPSDVPGGRLGLQIMRERAEAIDASFTVESAFNEGTIITVTVPS